MQRRIAGGLASAAAAAAVAAAPARWSRAALGPAPSLFPRGRKLSLQGSGAPSHATAAAVERGAEVEAASLRHTPVVFAVWGAAAGGAAFAALQHHVPPDLILLVDATFWLAVVCSISLTEAWVKFRAPLLDRWVGVDVGRRVFRAQYAAEGALAATAAAVLVAKAGGARAAAAALLLPAAQGGGIAPLAAAAAMLALEAAVVFPALDLRGRQLIAASAAAEPDTLSPRRLAYVAELRRTAAARPEPPAQLHLLSVALAAGKAGLLAAFVWGQLLAAGA